MNIPAPSSTPAFLISVVRLFPVVIRVINGCKFGLLGAEVVLEVRAVDAGRDISCCIPVPRAEDAPGCKSGNSAATSRALMALQSSEKEIRAEKCKCDPGIAAVGLGGVWVCFYRGALRGKLE